MEEGADGYPMFRLGDGRATALKGRRQTLIFGNASDKAETEASSMIPNTSRYRKRGILAKRLGMA